MSAIKVVVAFFYSFYSIIFPFLAFSVNGGIRAYYDNWSAEDAYTEEYAVSLEKNPDKDFVVLNLADIQLNSDEVYEQIGEITEATIKKAIEETQPDLITLSGDNSWSLMGYLRVVQFIDSFGIPWAPVMGNHDGGNGMRLYENWCAYLLYKAENSVFKFGPKGMGVGNYIINITENGEIIHTLYMLDTHTDSPKGGYDHLWDNQIEWYKWAVNGTNEIAGKTVESTAIFHIPVIQYMYAWDAVCGKFGDNTGRKPTEYGVEFTTADGHTVKALYGARGEYGGHPDTDNGFFDVVKELGSTKTILAGHDHVDNYAVEYDGITLAYSLKAGPGCYWDSSMNGGTTITINSNGNATVENHFVNPATLKTVPVEVFYR